MGIIPRGPRYVSNISWADRLKWSRDGFPSASARTAAWRESIFSAKARGYTLGSSSVVKGSRAVYILYVFFKLSWWLCLLQGFRALVACGAVMLQILVDRLERVLDRAFLEDTEVKLAILLAVSEAFVALR